MFAAEAEASAHLKRSLDELRDKMNEEREQALEEARRVSHFSEHVSLVSGQSACS